MTGGELGGFAIAVFGAVLIPGMDMLCVAGHGAASGRTGWMKALAGIWAGSAMHVLLGVLGVSALVGAAPAMVGWLSVLGGGYVLWIGVRLANSIGRSGQNDEGLGIRPLAGNAFRDGMVSNLLNPKSWLFMAAIFPPFVANSGGLGDAAARGILMLLVAMGAQALVYGVVGEVAGRGGRVNGELMTVIGASLLICFGVIGISFGVDRLVDPSVLKLHLN